MTKKVSVKLLKSPNGFYEVRNDAGKRVLYFTITKWGNITLYNAKSITCFDDSEIVMHCMNHLNKTYSGGEVKILNSPRREE